MSTDHDPSTTSGDDTGGARRGGVIVRWLVPGLVLLALLVALVAFRRQVYSYLTHWTGAPTQTVPYEALPAGSSPHIAAVGDAGDSGPSVDAVAAAMAEVDAEQPFDVLMLLGDNVYPSGDPARIPATVFEPFGPVLDGADLLAILGNHDVMTSDGSEQLAVLGMEDDHWAEVYDDTLVVGLNSNDLDDAQVAFLEETLAASDQRWKIVALHHPPYSAGYQGSSLGIRERLSPIFERYGVQLVLSGHDHDYQRSRTIDGVNYVVSGAGSGTRRTGAEDFTAASFSWLHFLEIGVYPDRMVLRSVSEDLEMADEFEIAPDGSVTELGP